jgi:cob(I)alamin adenosyltransferase
MKKSKLYTKTGDKGMTSLIGGKRVPKNHVRVETYGTVDELSAHLGLLIADLTDETTVGRLQGIQEDLFIVGAYLATEVEQLEKSQMYEMTDSDVERIEGYIDDTEDGLPAWKGFTLPGGSRSAAQCHVCRTVCRRLERRVMDLSECEMVASNICTYINRLSDYFYVLSRRLLFIEGKEEIIWKKRC